MLVEMMVMLVELMIVFLLVFAFIYVIVWTCRPSCRKCRRKVRRGATICPSCRSELGEDDLLPGASPSMYGFIFAGILLVASLGALSIQSPDAPDTFLLCLTGFFGVVGWATYSFIKETRELDPDSLLVKPLWPWFQEVTHRHSRTSETPKQRPEQQSEPKSVIDPPSPSSQTPPSLPPFTTNGHQPLCTKCRVPTQIRTELGKQWHWCPVCGRVSAADKDLR